MEYHFGMPPPASSSLPEAVAALCRSLAPADQSSLFAFAQFLKLREAQTSLDDVDEADEAKWEHEFSDPAKTANFARWAEQSLARGPARPIDPARL